MKTLTLALLTLFAITLTTPADVLVYKNRISGTDTGGGQTSKFTDSGYTIIDPLAANQPVMLIAFSKSKTFYVFDMFDCQLNLLTGRKGSKLVDYTAISQASLWEDTSGFQGYDIGTLKGVESTFSVGTTNLWSVPKTFSWVGRSLFPNANGDPILEETSGSLTVDMKWSTTANSFGDTRDAALDRMKNYLISLGYTEL